MALETTHTLINAVADIAAAHDYPELARDIRRYLLDGVPNVPIASPTDAPFMPDWANYQQGRKDGAAEAIPQGWRLVPDDVTDEWAKNYLSGVLNEDRHTRGKIDDAKYVIAGAISTAPKPPESAITR